MALKKHQLKTTEEHKGKRLDQVLADWLPTAIGQPISKGQVRKLVVAGAVYLNGKRVRIASKDVLKDARVDVYVDMAKLQSGAQKADAPFDMKPSHVLFEDQYIIVVNKPAGLPTQPTLDEARENLFAAVKKFLSKRDAVIEPYVGLHHRLDRDTSGVVLFTKVKEANAAVAELFSAHLAQKTYQCLTLKGKAPQSYEWTIKNHLGKDRSVGKRTKYAAVKSGGDYAETSFRLVEEFRSGLWIEAQPKTGRTHQIRVHLSEYGLPILGDFFYNGTSQLAPRLMLHASSLTFPHPVSKVEMSVQSPLPEDFVQCLQNLKK